MDMAKLYGTTVQGIIKLMANSPSVASQALDPGFKSRRPHQNFCPDYHHLKKSQFNDIGDKSPSDGGSLIFAAPFLRTPVFALQNFSNLAPYN